MSRAAATSAVSALVRATLAFQRGGLIMPPYAVLLVIRQPGHKMAESISRRFVTSDHEIDNCSPFAIMEPVWHVVDFYSDANSYLESVQFVTHRQRLMLAVVWYCAEVNNGGHEQFFLNSTGMLWRDAMNGFEEFGLPQLAALAEEAGARLDGEPPMDQAERKSVLKRLAPDFDDLDDRYVKLEEQLSLEDRLLDYMRQHRTDFYITVDS